MLTNAIGSVLLLAKDRNEPLGLRNAPARTSHSSIPTGYPHEEPPPPPPDPVPEDDGKKKTPDGQIILDPQPEESGNDPLNWPAWRRDAALLSLGLYCSKSPAGVLGIFPSIVPMSVTNHYVAIVVGGGITPLIAAGFTNVAHGTPISVFPLRVT